MPDPVEQYARDVRDGKIVANRYVRLACERHLRDLRDGPARGLLWDWPAAERAIGFFPDMLSLAEGQHEGAVFHLQAWQKFFVGSLLGWKGSDGYRRFRTCYSEIAKGNGKSPLAAGLALFGLIADGEAAAQVFSAGVVREQAKIVWTDAARMVRASAILRDNIDETVNNLLYRKNGSFFRPVSSDATSLDGFRPHFVVIDEVHEHPSAEVIDKLRAGFKGRRQPLMIEITNSGYDKHSVCWQHHEYSLKVLEGTVENDSWFAFVCGLDEGDDWQDERVWMKANPNLGVSVSLKYLREQVEEAKAMPAKQNIVRRLNFNQWTEQSTRAIDMDQWNVGGPPVGTPASELRDARDAVEAALRARKSPCWGGMDLAKVSDLSAFVLVFPPEERGQKTIVLPWFWCPEEDILKRSKRDRAPYTVWRDAGFLRATPGNTTDFKFITAEIIKLAGQFNIQEIAFDRTFAGEIVQELQDEGLALVEFGQGYLSMAAPTAELLRLVKAGELHHSGDPVLRWCASNLSVATDPAGNLKPDKARSSEKIDGIAALCNALGRVLKREGDGGSVYEKRGILTVGSDGVQRDDGTAFVTVKSDRGWRRLF